MNPSKLATVLGSFSLLTLAALTPDVAHAEEVWASPSASGGPFTDVGDWAVTRGGATYFSVAIPDDYDEFLGASILAIGSGLGGGGTNTFDVEIGVSVAASGDSSSAATFVTQQTITVTEGVLSDIDISAALDLAYLAGADYVAISITPPNGSSKHMNLVGMRFQYGSTDADTDPTNELNTAFTFAGADHLHHGRWRYPVGRPLRPRGVRRGRCERRGHRPERQRHLGQLRRHRHQLRGDLGQRSRYRHQRRRHLGQRSRHRHQRRRYLGQRRRHRYQRRRHLAKRQ